MKALRFEVRKDDLATARISETDLPSPGDGELLVEIDRFALTANNITYGVVGERIGYWKFFPADAGWGVIPVWGFAKVIASNHPEIEVGERLYGYFPMGKQCVMQAGKIRPDRLVDSSAHRASLPLVYNSYARTAGEAHYEPAMDDERMLLFPLYATSFCLYDFLDDNGYFGAEQVIVVSASSKTAIGLAYAFDMHEGPVACVGLTSSGNLERVRTLGLYDSVATYDALGSIDASLPTVIVDMSGNGRVLSDLHAMLGDNMRYTSNVGVTHYADNQMGPHFRRERSAMFFAPGHIEKRNRDWGPGEFQQRAYRFWREASIRSRDWLRIETTSGLRELPGVYAQLLAGRVAPDVGIVIEV
ncbi:MAG: DUF2855 family protein [Gammaproteobacteria bacterium]|nr:DUF2855 family protein [Gammaproteobacteria bacterium]MDH4254357.1 DUF2855 family protein [Gammaproteobacteria bacterium]MDH5309374.1 DUF2855 family protein [Gammaproteobacteria bacterium]